MSEVEAAPPPRSKHNRALLVIVGILVGGTVLGVWLYNQHTLQKPLNKVLLSDPRNGTVHASARFDGWIDTDTVVFEITTIDGESSQMDVFRVLLQFAREQQHRRFQKVILAAYGEKKFVLTGEYFQTLGREYESQNPVYTMRTFPRHVMTLDGNSPFPEPRGGFLWVLREEMEQFTELNKRWYLDEFTARHK